jgi:hypothetical protein
MSDNPKAEAGGRGKPKIKMIVEASLSAAHDLLGKQAESVTNVAKDEDGWRTVVEVLERKSIPDTQDIIAKYEMRFDSDCDLLGYRRVELRRRGEMEVVEDED